MATNEYHLLNFIPATEAWEMPPALEALAQALVRSGRLRINADTERNYVRVGASNSDQTFTARELTDPALHARTRKALARYVAPAEGPEGFLHLTDRLMRELKTARGVSAEKEMKVARVLVQSAHPAVIHLLLANETELFVSYSHTVGDLMPVHAWTTNGTASGLQATGFEGTAVYISAGGDPFFEGEQKHYVTDGFPALARMVVIAGQELGHFADLKRSRQGIIGRHSTDHHHHALRAAPLARDGRVADIQRTEALAAAYARAGLARLREAEKRVAFYHTRLRYSPRWFWHQARRFLAWVWFVKRCKALHIHLKLAPHPYHRHGEAVAVFLSDMAFNLAPDADVYRDPDPLVEEAIAVIEAVARVPQQTHKWGPAAVSLAWPNLYRFYFGTVIPACVTALGSQPIATASFSFWQTLTLPLRRLLRTRPGYYP